LKDSLKDALRIGLKDYHKGFTEFLIQNGADDFDEGLVSTIKSAKYYTEEELTEEELIQLIELLIKNGANLNYKNGKSFRIACQSGSLNIIKFLYNKDSNLINYLKNNINSKIKSWLNTIHT